MTPVTIKYVTDKRGSGKTVVRTLEVYERFGSGKSFHRGDRYYTIDDSGCYPLLKQVVQGKCNTFERTIGRRPEVNWKDGWSK